MSSSLITPKEGLKRLMEGNFRYANDQLEHPNRGQERREALFSSQSPYAVIVACSDSRVSPEILFDEGVGDLFVVRVAGNVIGPIELDSIEYAALCLHSALILVMGHENCGAVQAVIQDTKDIPAVSKLIKPAVKKAKKVSDENLLERSVKMNAQRMKEHLLNTPSIQNLVKDQKLEVHAAYYHLKTGSVELLEN